MRAPNRFSQQSMTWRTSISFVVLWHALYCISRLAALARATTDPLESKAATKAHTVEWPVEWRIVASVLFLAEQSCHATNASMANYSLAFWRKGARAFYRMSVVRMSVLSYASHRQLLTPALTYGNIISFLYTA